MATRNTQLLGNTGPIELALAGSNTSKVVVSDISDAPTAVKIIRNGKEFVAPAFEEQRVIALKDKLAVQPRARTPRVLTQSIAAGTLVAPGTVVNLVMAAPDAVDMGIFTGVHADLAGKPLSQVMEITDNEKVRKVLNDFDDAASVPAAQREVLIDAFKGNAQVDNADKTKSFDALFTTAKNAFIYL